MLFGYEPFAQWCHVLGQIFLSRIDPWGKTHILSKFGVIHTIGSRAICVFVNKSIVMCLYRPLVAVFVVLENSFLVKSGRGQTKLSFGTSNTYVR